MTSSTLIRTIQLAQDARVLHRPLSKREDRFRVPSAVPFTPEPRFRDRNWPAPFPSSRFGESSPDIGRQQLGNLLPSTIRFASAEETFDYRIGRRRRIAVGEAVRERDGEVCGAGGNYARGGTDFWTRRFAFPHVVRIANLHRGERGLSRSRQYRLQSCSAQGSFPAALLSF